MPPTHSLECFVSASLRHDGTMHHGTRRLMHMREILKGRWVVRLFLLYMLGIPSERRAE